MGQEIKLNIELSPEHLRKIEKIEKALEGFSKPQPPEEYLTKSEVAALLKVHPDTVYNWTRKKILNSYGLSGRGVYYKRSEIEASLIPLK